MKTINEILKKTLDEYEDIVFQHWFNYCGKHSAGPKSCQQLLANTALFAWWQVEYRRLEEEFLSDMDGYIEVANPHELLDAYNGTVVKVHMYRCPPLMDAAQKLTITV